MNYKLIKDTSGLSNMVAKLSECKVIGLDLETTALEPIDGKIRLMQFSDGADLNYIIDLFKLPTADAIRLVFPLLLSEYPRKIIQNQKFEQRWIQFKYGITVKGVFDTYIASRLVDDLSSGKLDDIIFKWLGVEISKEEQRSDWSVPELSESQLQYAIKDVWYLPKVREKLIAEIKRLGMVKTAELEFNCTPVVANMENKGFPLDIEMHTELIETIIERRDKCQEELENILNKALGKNKSLGVQGGLFGQDTEIITDKINLNSPKQVLEAYQAMGVNIPSTGKNVVTPAMVIQYPQLEYLTRYRDEQILITMFGDKLLKMVHPVTGRIHPTFWQLMTVTARFSCKNPNCFPPEVEILTKKGWQRFDELEKGLPVATFSTNTGEISFDVPTHYIEQGFKGALLKISTQEQIDMVSTSEHEYLVRNKKTGDFKKVVASELKPDYHLLSAASYRGGGIELTEDEVILLCATQADAHINASGMLDFVFQKERKIIRLVACLDRLGIEYRKVPKGSGTRITISKNNVPDYAIRHFEDLLSYSAKTLEYISKEVFLWDGESVRKSAYTAKKKENCDWVQIALILNGRRATVRSRTVGGKLYWDVYASNRAHSLTTNLTKTNVNYEGKVYCVTVPSGNIVVRHNGKVLIIGNCQQIPKTEEFRRCWRPLDPDRTFVISDYGGMELRILAQLSQDAVMLNTFNSGGDLHSLTAKGAFNLPCPVEEVATKYPKERGYAKGLNFGIVYGIGAKKYADKVNIPVLLAKKAIKGFYETYDGAKEYLYGIEEIGIAQRHVRSFSGRKMNLRFDPNNEFEVSGARRDARNYPIQASCSDVMKIAMANIFNALQNYDADIVNIVHDEIIIESHKSCAEEVKFILESEMIKAAKIYMPDVAVDAEAKICSNWAEK